MKKLIITLLLLTGVLMSGTAAAENAETFENGVRWKAIPREYTRTVTVAVFIKGGLFRETAENNGVGALFARTWLKSGNLLEKVEFVGGGVNASLAHDYLEITLSVPTDELSALLPELKRQLLTPDLSEAVFNKEKDLTMREIEAEKDDPNSLAFQLFMEATYKGHPYALKTDGKMESVSKLTLKDIKDYHASQMPALDTIVAVAGNYTKKDLDELKAIFKAMPEGKKVKISCEKSGIAENALLETTDARIQQAKLFLAYSAPSAASSDYLPSKVMSDLLGGGMSSPYFTALRKDRGYAYSVGVMYPSRLCDSRMVGYIGLQAENIDDAVHVMKQINTNIADSITDAELDKSKNHMLGQMLLGAETNSRTAWYAAFFENLGLGFDHTTEYVEQIRQVKKTDIKRVSKIFEKPYTVFVLKPSGEAALEK